MTAGLNLNLRLDSRKEEVTEERVKKAVKKKKEAKEKYIPSWREVWVTGYTTHTGKRKAGIFQTKLTDKDKEKLIEIKGAIEAGEISTGVESLDKLTKTRALNLWNELKEVRRESIIKKMIEEKPANYHMITSERDLKKLIEDLMKEEEFAFDTETTGLEVFGRDYIVGMSFTLPKADYHVYIPIRHLYKEITGQDEKGKDIFVVKPVKNQLPAETVFSAIKKPMETESIRKYYFNAKFDIHMLRKEGVGLKGLYMDASIAMHLLNENEPSYALKNLATKYGKYFGFEDKSMTYEELFGKGGFEFTPLDIGTVYACKDTHLTYKFGKWVLEQLRRIPELWDLYFNIELPTIWVSVEMEKNGFAVDLEFAEQYKQTLKDQLEKLDEEIKQGFGDININSNQQLGDLIYSQWGVKDEFGGSVDKKTLEKIVALHSEDIPQVKYIESLLEYRKLNKLLTTYIEPLPEKISPLDGRLHGNFNQVATVTGRFASDKPNLQNLPYDARKMFIAPEGKIIVGSDYSQIEPRFLSHISGDMDFRTPYLTGQDLYSQIASKVFKQPLEECGDGTEWRKMAKVILLGMMYGISSLSLAEQFHITNQEAEQIYKDFHSSYPVMAEWFAKINKQANTEGYVKTFMGRKRRFLGHKEIAKKYFILHSRLAKKLGKDEINIWEEYRKRKVTYKEARAYQDIASPFNKVQRQSINAVIQGSSADIMKLAMIKILDYCKSKGEDWKMLCTVHDEVLVEIPATATKEEVEEIANIQKSAIKLDVPMKCDVEVSARWGCGVSFEEWVQAGCERKVFEEEQHC
ncbi:DNA polymerase I [Clostridium perfringens]|nr:DNA polymerase I [Clostridium perfringens]